MSYSDNVTDQRLIALERRIKTNYRRSWIELSAKAEEFNKTFEKQDALMLEELQKGNITKSYYKQWRINHIGMGKRWEQMRDQMADRMVHADQVAASYINDTTPGIYTLNHNYSAYEITGWCEEVNACDGMKLRSSWTLLDEQTIKRLMTDDVAILPFKKASIDVATDYGWLSKKLQNELLAGILAGDSVYGISSRFQNVVNMSEKAAIRSARTAITGAQNAGRLEAILAAQKMGINGEKEWMSTLDAHTRDSHRRLDGETVKANEYFSNDCKYPGDPFGPPKEVYNCRCTMTFVPASMTNEAIERFARDADNGSTTESNITYTGKGSTMSYAQFLRGK